MKQNSLYRTGIVITIIVLFTSLFIIPTSTGNIKDRDLQQQYNRLTNTYTDIDGDGRNGFDIANCYYVNPPHGIEPLLWWNFWRDFPGRYEPFFDVYDIIDFGQTAWGLTSADFNDNGFMDFAVSWATSPWTQSTISVFYNDGESKFTREDIYTITEPNLRYIDDLDSGDYDNDDDIDFMYTYSEYIPGAYTNGTVNLLFNDGNNNFNDSIMVAKHQPTNDGRKRIHSQITSADFDNDGDIDFLVGDNSGLVEFYKNNGTGKFSSAGVYDFGGEMSWGLSSADFDDDGDIDFIVTQIKNIDAGYVYLKWNDGSQSCFNHSNFIKIADLPPHASFFTMPTISFGCLCSIDYNDDGKMDFLFAGGDSVFLYIQQEMGAFDYFTICHLPMHKAEDESWYFDDLRNGGITIGDFNGDKLDDMVIGGVQGVVRLFYNNLVLVDIIHPDRAVFIIDNVIIYNFDPIMIYRFIKHGTSIAIGDLTIEAKALEPLQKVEFYLGIRLMHTDDSEPFEWKWTGFSFGRHKVKAVAYNLDGEQSGYDDTIVWKFF